MQLVSAAMTNPLDSESGVPSEIVYIPEGSHTITPSVNGKAQTITVNVPPDRGEELAGRLQASLADRLKASVRPHLDFDHAHSGPAAAIPTAFRYEKGKGIVLALDWTGKGKSAIEGKDFSYFSPEFLIAEDGTPHALPEKGPIGSLVNEPAFREIPRIAASQAEPTEPDNNTDMNLLVQCGLLSEKEAALPNHVELASKRVKAMEENAKPNESALSDKEAKIKELEAELATLKKEKEDAAVAAKQAAEKAADERVKEVEASHHLKPEEKTLLREQILAGNPLVSAMIATLPKKGDPNKPVIQANNSEKKEGEKEEATGLSRVAAALAAEASAN
jgi:phage I-like protein